MRAEPNLWVHHESIWSNSTSIRARMYLVCAHSGFTWSSQMHIWWEVHAAGAQLSVPKFYVREHR